MKRKKHRVLLRADGGKKTGIGHLVRSLTLATALKESGVEVLLAGDGARNAQLLDPSFSHVQVADINFPGLDPEVRFIDSWCPDLVIADGYAFTAGFFSLLRERKIPFGVIDDNFETQAERPLFLLNQNPIANRDMYPKDWTETTFLLGLEFALIRQAILEKGSASNCPRGNMVLLTIGGTDSLGVAPLLAESLHRLGLPIAIPGNQVADQAKLIKQTGMVSQRTLVFSPSDYPAHLSAAKFAVLGGGSSLYEALALEIPTIAVVVAENQMPSARLLRDRGHLVGLVDMQIDKSESLLEFEHMVKRLVSDGPKSLPSGLDLTTGKIRAVEEISRLLLFGT